VNVQADAVDQLKTGRAPFDFETTFRAQYERIARVIARVVKDRARAEELAVEVFLKLWRNPQAQGGGNLTRLTNVEGWLYRAAVRMALDELRRRARRDRYERLLGLGRRVPTPEDVRGAAEQQRKIRLVLAAIEPRQAELLLLRSHGLSYEELASALDLNPASVGTLLSRAQQAFRKEYGKRYGEEHETGIG
jgi:RNA polymerase sigma-70 factor (ECF subfamily)